MKPKYMSKMCQKQREKSQANRTESKKSNKPNITSAERMTKLRERSPPRAKKESTQYSTRSLCNSYNSTFVIHSFYYLCNKCILIHKTFISFHIYTRIQTFLRKKASVVYLKYYPPHLFQVPNNGFFK
jgi:hypothetical protein